MRRAFPFLGLLAVLAFVQSGCVVTDLQNQAFLNGAIDNLSHKVIDCDTFDAVSNTQQTAEVWAIGNTHPGIAAHKPPTALQYFNGYSLLVTSDYGMNISRADAQEWFRFIGAAQAEGTEVATSGVGSNAPVGYKMTPIPDPDSGSMNGIMIFTDILPYLPGIKTWSCNQNFSWGRSSPHNEHYGGRMVAGTRYAGRPSVVSIDTRAGCQYGNNIIAANITDWLGGSGHNGWAYVCQGGSTTYGNAFLSQTPIQRTGDATPMFGEPTSFTVGDLSFEIIADLDEISGDITFQVLSAEVRGYRYVPEDYLEFRFDGGHFALALDPKNEGLQNLVRWMVDELPDAAFEPFEFERGYIPFLNHHVGDVSVKIDRSMLEHWLDFYGGGTEPTRRRDDRR